MLSSLCIISVLYEHVETSIEDRLEFVSFSEFRFELLLLLLLLFMILLLLLRVSEILRLLAGYLVESPDVFDEYRCSAA